MDGSFKTVEFTQGGVAVIPHCWIYKDQLQTRCYWPGDKKASAYAIKRTAPNSKEWQSYEIKIIFSCETFSEARHKMVKYVRDTDISASEFETGYGKRIKKKHKSATPIHVSESESDEKSQDSGHEIPELPVLKSVITSSNSKAKDSSIDSTNAPRKKSYKRPSSDNIGTLISETSDNDHRGINQSFIESRNNSKEQAVLENDVINNRSVIDYSSLDEESDETDFIRVGPRKVIKNIMNNSKGNTLKNVNQRRASTPKPNEASNLRGEIVESSSNGKVLISESYLRSLSRNQEVMKSNLRHLTEMMECVLKNSQSGQAKPLSGEETAQLEEMFGFPFSNELELNLLEESLNSVENVTKLRAYLKQFGGITLYDCVKRILVHVFLDTLAKEYSWEGRKGKRALNNLRLMKVIIETVRSVKNFKETTIAEIEKNIKSWFTHAPDRVASKTATAAKKNQNLTK